jgi:predicted permease
MTPFRYALRSLRKSPGFVAVTTVSLGLALGLCTTTFAILDGMMHPNVPIRDAGRVYTVIHAGDGAGRDVTAYDRYARLRDGAGFHAGMAAMTSNYDVLYVDGVRWFGPVLTVSANYLTVLGIELYRGRGFRPANDPLDDHAAVVGYGVWRQSFEGVDLEDATITIHEETYRVVGVLPPNLEHDVLLRLPGNVATDSTLANRIRPITRLRDGVTREAAVGELDAIAETLNATLGVGRQPFGFGLQSVMPDPLKLTTLHYALGGAALAVLLIACANLANLMLARGYARRGELALQTALGATRNRLIRLVVAESVTIVTLGGILGVILTVWGVSLVTHRMPPEIEYIGQLAPAMSWRVVAFALAAMGGTVGIFGLIPAVRSSNVELSEPLKGTSGTTTPTLRRRYSRLVISEIAASMILLMGTGLLIHASKQIGAYDFGYDPSRLFRSGVFLRGEAAEDPEPVFQRIVENVAAIPGIQSVGTMASVPPANGLVISELSSGGSDARLNVRAYQESSPNLLRTLGLRIVSGRDFLPGDEQGDGSVILDEDAARALFRGEDAVGKNIKLGAFASERPWLPVVGVVQNAALRFVSDPDLQPLPKIYVAGNDARSRNLIVRAETTHPSLATRIGEEIEISVPGQYLAFVFPWQGSFDGAIRARKFMAGVFGIFGAFALVLAGVGLYGVLTFAVGQRMREFGIRIALGARATQVLRLVVHDGVVMILAGTGIGAFAAMWAGGLFGSWLYSVPPTDVRSLLGAEVVLLVTTLAACLSPAIRASAADPLETLRAT